MFGPPAIGSMKAKEEANVTTRRNCAGLYPLSWAVAAMIEPKIDRVAMLDTTSVTKQMTEATISRKAVSPVWTAPRFSATQAASPDWTVPCAIAAPPPKTNRISHWKLPFTMSQSRMRRARCSPSAGGTRERQRSSPTSRRQDAGSRAPQGRRNRGSVSARPMEPLLSSLATYCFQPGKPPMGEAVNQSTMRTRRSAATTI
mmetsp:Transcript_86420/g.225468  ORF Transcript_86420/g.225468 Transcript_86420/m.225468 type:complete len:201 (+) Transcript_86420:142-744(+)